MQSDSLAPRISIVSETIITEEGPDPKIQEEMKKEMKEMEERQNASI